MNDRLFVLGRISRRHRSVTVQNARDGSTADTEPRGNLGDFRVLVKRQHLLLLRRIQFWRSHQFIQGVISTKASLTVSTGMFNSAEISRTVKGVSCNFKIRSFCAAVSLRVASGGAAISIVVFLLRAIC